MTDDWRAYQTIVPQNKHVRSNAETFKVEGYSSLFRAFPERLRKSKSYSKKSKRLKEAIFMLILKRNQQLSILY